MRVAIADDNDVDENEGETPNEEDEVKRPKYKDDYPRPKAPSVPKAPKASETKGEQPKTTEPRRVKTTMSTSKPKSTAAQ